MKDSPIFSKELAALKKRLFVYKIAVMILTALLAGVLGRAFFYPQRRGFSPSHERHSKKDLPYHDTIMGIIRPLEYSGLPQMSRPQVSLSIDFNKRIWTLRNVHKYDPEGRILLDEGRYGLCSELAVYVYQKLKPLLTDQYEIKFARVAESGFFLTPQSTHVILLVLDKARKDTYLIDPSFHRYGRLNDFDEYFFFDTEDTFSFVRDRSPDVFFAVDHATPILIQNDFLLHFSVESTRTGDFDKDNFVLAVRATHRYKFSGHYVFAVRKRHGKMQTFEDKWMIEETLKPGEFEALKSKLMSWFEQIHSAS